MTRSIVPFLTAALLPFAGHAQSTTAPSTTLAEEQRVLAADDAYVQAEVQRDEAAIRGLVDDRFV